MFPTDESASKKIPNEEKEDEEEDYMSMAILEPSKPTGTRETYTQRKLRQQREVILVDLCFSLAVFNPTDSILTNNRHMSRN